MTKRRPRCDSCGLTDRMCKCVPKQISTQKYIRDLFGVNINEVKVIPTTKIIMTEKIAKEYERDLETISEIQLKLIKFGIQADQLHPLRRQKYASILKNQKDMWEMIAKNMIGGGEKVNLRNVKSPHCNIEIPLLKDEEELAK